MNIDVENVESISLHDALYYIYILPVYIAAVRGRRTNKRIGNPEVESKGVLGLVGV